MMCVHDHQLVKKEYEGKRAVLGAHQPIEFESDKITLDIPMEGITANGWEITPLVPPVVSLFEHHIQMA